MLKRMEECDAITKASIPDNFIGSFKYAFSLHTSKLIKTAVYKVHLKLKVNY